MSSILGPSDRKAEYMSNLHPILLGHANNALFFCSALEIVDALFAARSGRTKCIVT